MLDQRTKEIAKDQKWYNGNRNLDKNQRCADPEIFGPRLSADVDQRSASASVSAADAVSDPLSVRESAARLFNPSAVMCSMVM